MATYIERYQNIEDAGRLHNKGYKFTEIARELNITPAQASSFVGEYKQLLNMRAENDPDFLERITENTLEMIDSLDTILREAWEAHAKAKDFEMINMQATTLKLAMDITERKAKLLQLMGGRTDGSSVARMTRAERVNEIVSGIIKETIANCPQCAQVAQIKLAEAFRLMDRAEEASVMEEMIEDIEEEEELPALEEHNHEDDAAYQNMLGDVLSKD